MKKRLIVGSLILISVFLLTGCLPKKPSPGSEVTPTPETEPLPTAMKSLESSILERPFVSLTPTSDGHWVNLEVNNIRSDAKSIDYELIYFAGDIGNKIERGTSGLVDLKGETSLTRKVLFGSESCTVSCKYKYDENISEGTLTIKIRSDAGVEKYTSAFRLQKGLEAKEGLSAGDGNFKFTSSVLPKNNYFLTISTVGLPKEVGESVIMAPYGVFPSSSTVGTVACKTNDEAAKILFWNSQKWEELKTSYTDGWLSAPVQKTGVFVLVK
jgi:hypothetical protein